MTNERLGPSWWDEGVALSAEKLGPAVDVLVDAAELIAVRLRSVDCTGEELSKAKHLAITSFVSEALSKVDAAIALITVGCFDQIEPLLRSMHELIVDLYLITEDEAAFDIWVNWQTVEQAVLALKMNPSSVVREDRDLLDRRAVLASQLRSRLRTTHEDQEAELGEDADLATVVDSYSRHRIGSRFPTSWRREYQHLNDIDRENLINRVAKAIWRQITNDAPVLLEAWSTFKSDIEADFEAIYSYRSGALHNSTMAISRKIDASTLVPSVHGSSREAAAPLGGMIVQVHRVMALFERVVCHSESLEVWEGLMQRMQDWQESLGESPLPHWFRQEPTDG